MARILVVEDDAKLRAMITGALERYGFVPLVPCDLAKIKEEYRRLKPDLVLLDINLPYYDGFFWCRQIRAVSSVPIIFLSARTGDVDQVLAIEGGGDDYITKPFSLDVLVAKVRSVLRRVYGEYAGPPLDRPLRSAGGLTLDEEREEVAWRGRRTALTRTEARLLGLLVRRTGRIVSREDLLEELWDAVDFVDDNTLTVNVSRVRRKLGEIGFDGAIVTKRGHGYLLKVPDA